MGVSVVSAMAALGLIVVLVSQRLGRPAGRDDRGVGSLLMGSAALLLWFSLSFWNRLLDPTNRRSFASRVAWFAIGLVVVLWVTTWLAGALGAPPQMPVALGVSSYLLTWFLGSRRLGRPRPRTPSATSP
jgi:hypothetical protein